MLEAIRSSETFLTRASGRHIPEDGILHFIVTAVKTQILTRVSLSRENQIVDVVEPLAARLRELLRLAAALDCYCDEI
jgi:hypothetical protein